MTDGHLTARGSTHGLIATGDGFELDGQRFQIISAAIHYFRIHPAQWRDRLQRVAALGVNTIETYAAWNFHEPVRGQVDFTGWRDIGAFLRLAAALNLRVIFRPGPYIAAEWEFGGLPAWLLNNPDQPLRCSDPVYTAAVDDWFTQLIPQIAELQASRGGPIIAVQVENEHGTYGNDRGHLEHLADTLTRLGIDQLLFCNNGVEADHMQRDGSLPHVLSTADFDTNPDEAFAMLRRHQPNGPLFCTELWDGWFDHWGEHHHTTDPDLAADTARRILQNGGSLNLYMGIGGTNFGWGAGATSSPQGLYQPITTSYDYDAPIGEAGDVGAKFNALRQVISTHSGQPAPPLPPLPPRLCERTVTPSAFLALSNYIDLQPDHRRAAPIPMEQLAQNYGLINYRTTASGPRPAQPLTIAGLGDRAVVIVDGRPVGTLDRNRPNDSVMVSIAGDSAQLDLLVDAGGRINYGPHLNDTKGIRGNVLLGGQQALFGWDITPLPLDDVDRIAVPAGTSSVAGLYRATVEIGDTGDAFIALPGWTKGLVWLNGFLLGRYWNIGPQRALYAPHPLWTTGHNTITVLELHQPGQDITLRNRPDLDTVHPR